MSGYKFTIAYNGGDGNDVDLVADVAPVLANIETTALAYTEGQSATPVTGNLTVSDVDSTVLTRATVSIASASAEESLVFSDQNGITGNYTAGVLTLTGTTSLGNYTTALHSVTYLNTSNNPAASRTISFQVTDDGNMTSNVASRNVAITAINSNPVISLPGGTLNYTENDPATVIDAGAPPATRIRRI